MTKDDLLKLLDGVPGNADLVLEIGSVHWDPQDVDVVVYHSIGSAGLTAVLIPGGITLHRLPRVPSHACRRTE